MPNRVHAARACASELWAARPERTRGTAALKKDGPAAFEALQAQLKRAGCRMSAPDSISTSTMEKPYV